MTTIDSYHTQMVATEQSPHTSEETHVLQRGESNSQYQSSSDDETIEALQSLAGCVE